VRFLDGPQDWIPGIDCLEYRRFLGEPFHPEQPEYRMTPQGWALDPPKAPPPACHNVRKAPKNPAGPPPPMQAPATPPVTQLTYVHLPPPQQSPAPPVLMSPQQKMNFVSLVPGRPAFSHSHPHPGHHMAPPPPYSPLGHGGGHGHGHGHSQGGLHAPPVTRHPTAYYSPGPPAPQMMARQPPPMGSPWRWRS
jgi:hypothetical protein